jgi:hypothetical protein
MATWIEKLGDEIASSPDKIKEAIQNIKSYVVDKFSSFKLKLPFSIDVELRLVLDDSFIKIIDKIAFVIDNAVNKISAEFKILVKQIFSDLSKLIDRIDNAIDKFFTGVSNTINDIQKKIVNPILEALLKLEEKFFKDLNQVLDKVFNFFTGTLQDIRDDIDRIISFLIPNPFDPCRQATNTTLIPGPRLTSADLFNLFECHQLKRLENSSTKVKEINEIYGVLQLQAFRLNCLSRGAPGLEEIFTKRWIQYGQLCDLWKEFNNNMTAQQAFDEAIKRLDQARSEYMAKSAQIDSLDTAIKSAQNAADNAQNTANNAQATASSANGAANNAQNTANGAIKNIEFYSVEAVVDTTVQSNDIVINFPVDVDAVMLQTMTNDNNQIVRAGLDRLNSTAFKVHVDGVEGNGHRWIPSLRYIGMKLRR